MDLDASMKQLRQLWAFKNRVEAILPDLEALVSSGKQTSEDFTKVLGELDPNATIVPDPTKITPIAGPQSDAGALNSGARPTAAPLRATPGAAPVRDLNAPLGPETADPSAQGSG